ncbi:PEP-CTERM sorting domain-containing protein [Verrucomicrobium spinosum]|uniref:PEP-CTERM sorting domain-containing protein n=1 Tax=Verrucomicrobium spinosum TaxID=2736 RepID=UPI00017460B5|nr:PEP-CTERM sorting domain-containing protein [Verrucomicrobium spinosum]
MKPLLIILAAGLWIGASTASAQVLIANALDRTPSETVTQTTLVATVGTTTNSNLGAGWNASNTFAGVLSTQTMTLNPGIADDSGGLFQIAQGGVAGVAGSFSATKAFTGITLLDNTTYNLTISGNSSATVSILSSLNVNVLVNGATIYQTPTSTLLGLVDQTTTESFTFSFTTGEVNNVQPVNIQIAGNTLVAALGQSASLTKINLAVAPVPEPGSLLLFLTGIAATMRRQRPRR